MKLELAQPLEKGRQAMSISDPDAKPSRFIRVPEIHRAPGKFEGDDLPEDLLEAPYPVQRGQGCRPKKRKDTMKSKGKKIVKYDTKSASYATNDATITVVQYRSFQAAFDFFNQRLFDKSLPQLLVTLARKGASNGYFSPNRFVARANDRTTHELCLNPDSFTGRSDEEILSTLCHEMVHFQQHTLGNAPRRNYHNKAFAALMKQIGLHPSSTGQPGGKEIGGHMSHFIVPGGRFQLAYKGLAATGFKLDWQSKPPERKQRQSKTKFTCPRCQMNVWGAPPPSVEVDCHKCHIPMVATTTGSAEVVNEAELAASYHAK